MSFTFAHLLGLFMICQLLITSSSKVQNEHRSKKQGIPLSAPIRTKSSPMVSAVLLECPKEPLRKDQSSKYSACEEQLVVNIRVNPSFHIQRVEKFLILDEVYDPQKRTKAKILSPYLIEISRGEPVMMYPLEFSKSLKCETCEPRKEKPTKTCKQMHHKKKPCEARLEDSKLSPSTAAESFKRVVEKIQRAFPPVTDRKGHRNKERNDKIKLHEQGYKDHDYTEVERAEKVKQVKTTEKQEEGTDLRRQNSHLEKTKILDDTDERNVNEKYVSGRAKSHEATANADVDSSLIERFNQHGNLAQLGLVKHRSNAESKITEGNQFEKPLEYDDDSKHSSKDTYKKKRRSEAQNQKRQQLQSEYYLDSEQNRDTEEEDSVGLEANPNELSKIRRWQGPNSRQYSPDAENEPVENEDALTTASQFKNQNLRSGFKGCPCKTKANSELESDESESTDMVINDDEIYDEGKWNFKKLNTANNHYQHSSDKKERSSDMTLLNTALNNPAIKKKITEAIQRLTIPEFGKRDDYSMQELSNIQQQLFFDPRKVVSSSEANIKIPVQFYLFNKNDDKEEDFASLDESQSRESGAEESGIHHSDERKMKYSIYNELKKSNNKNYGKRKQSDLKKALYESIKKIRHQSEKLQPKVLSLKTNKITSSIIQPFKIKLHKEIEKDDTALDESDVDFNLDYQNYKDQKPYRNPFQKVLDKLENNFETYHNEGNSLIDPNKENALEESVDPYWTARNRNSKIVKSSSASSSSEPSQTSTYYKLPEATRADTKELWYKHHEPYLPQRPPYSQILEDPNLNLKDKLHMINVLDPYNAETEKKLSQLSDEVEQSYKLHPMPHSVLVDNDQADSRKTKRSYLFYDDLEMRDTLEDNDFNTDSSNQKRFQSGSARHVADDVQPCASCGGKGKKPQGKTDSGMHTRESLCNCENDPSSCICADSKMPRSVADTWYSVFNMSAPLPFLITKVRIFQKRRNTWWKIAPSITLSSLSGVFANANLSILFSSHVDIFQLEKSLRLQNHKLLIPKDSTSRTAKEDRFTNLNLHEIKPNRVLAIDSNKFNFDFLKPHYKDSISSKATETLYNSPAANMEHEINKKLCGEIRSTVRECSVKNVQKEHNSPSLKISSQFTGTERTLRSMESNSLHTIADFGYVPVTMDLLERCPNDKNRLCLNILEDRVPAYSIKIKMPFRNNMVVHRNVFKVKIMGISTDATTKDALQVSVDVISESLEKREFSICICNCLTACASVAKTSVQKVLLPYVGETVSFLLPLILDPNHTNKKFSCDVIVSTKVSNATLVAGKSIKSSHPKSGKSKRGSIAAPTSKEMKITIAQRQLLVKKDSRCICVWDCSCHCVDKLETHVDFNVCKKLPQNEQKDAGLIASEQIDIPIADEIEGVSRDEHDVQYGNFLTYAIMLVIVMLLLGLLKAMLGLFITCIDKYGYNYIQPGRRYSCSSRARRFCVNSVFFVISPFLFWCKCFTPSEEDLLVASTEWHCSESKEKIDIINDGFRSTSCDDDEDCELFLSQNIVRKYNSENRDSRLIGGENELYMEKKLQDLSVAFDEGEFDDEEEEQDDHVSTHYVLQVLAESKHSLDKLLQDHSNEKAIENIEQDDTNTQDEAEELFQSLKSARIVYRTFDKPIGNVQMAPGQKYCIQGYFFAIYGARFKFLSFDPLLQFRTISANGTVEIFREPLTLCRSAFPRFYENKSELLSASDLSPQIPPNVICINIPTKETSATPSLVTSNTMIDKDSTSNCSHETPHRPQNRKFIDYRSSITTSVYAPLQEETEDSDQLSSDYICSNNFNGELIDIDLSEVSITARKSSP